MIKQKEVDFERERLEFIEQNTMEYEKKVQAEVLKMQAEHQKQHANLTKEIYEDVQKTLKDENKRR